MKKFSYFFLFLIVMVQALYSAATIHLKNYSGIPDHAFAIEWGPTKLEWGVTKQAENFAPILSAKDTHFTLRIYDFSYCTHRGVTSWQRYCTNASVPLKVQDGKVYLITGIDTMGNIIVQE